jgi:hypothetical protein
MNKKERKRLTHEAEKKRIESEARRKVIRELSHAIEEFLCRGVASTDAHATANEWAEKWKIDGKSLVVRTPSNSPLRLLTGLVEALKSENKYLAESHQFVERAGRLCPDEFEKFKVVYLRALAPHLRYNPQKLDPAVKKRISKRMYDRKRAWTGDIGLIEWEFGGGAEDEWRKRMQQFPPALWPDHPIYRAPPPTCLDAIFAGRDVNMRRLQELFGMDWHPLERLLLSGKKKRRRQYDWRDVVQIMDSLLSKRQERKKPGRGRPPRKPWLDHPADPDLRSRVLKGIEARLNSLSVNEDIKTEFLKVIDGHLPNSGKKIVSREASR